jgi:cephalosporin-C deacetylase-like acetyl esterase
MQALAAKSSATPDDFAAFWKEEYKDSVQAIHIQNMAYVLAFAAIAMIPRAIATYLAFRK